jgi:hypothetical protein
MKYNDGIALLIAILIVFFVSATVAWLLLGFIGLEWNVLEWNSTLRGMVVSIALSLAVLTYIRNTQ